MNLQSQSKFDSFDEAVNQFSMARTSLDCALHGGTLRTQCWFGAICLDTAFRSEFQKSLYGDRTLRGGRLAEKAGRKKSGGEIILAAVGDLSRKTSC
jgi:hypothetical protein